QHLQQCPSCRQKFKGLNATNQLLSNGLALPADIKVDLWDSVKSRLNEDCALIQSELSAYIDQEVATLRHRSITTHLLDCPTCRCLFEQLAEVGDIIRSTYTPKLPANLNLWPGIKTKLEVVPFPGKDKTQKRLSAHRLHLVGAAAIVVVITGALALFVLGSRISGIQPVSAETYLLESALMEPAENVEAVVYEEP
ncbi:MAG: zf-HC2 domain-containing protein, partial [Candidatus Melainabacteria bacterium]|nr:zf-HC2 domain-containing protein [Candidatus Melainabacteria bacterium]